MTADARTTYTRHPELLAAEMDGDLVVMSIDAGAYFGLGGIGPALWEMLSAPRTEDELVAAVRAEYDVEDEACRTDVRTFVTQLVEHGLVLRSDS